GGEWRNARSRAEPFEWACAESCACAWSSAELPAAAAERSRVSASAGSLARKRGLTKEICERRACFSTPFLFLCNRFETFLAKRNRRSSKKIARLRRWPLQRSLF